MRLDVPLYSDRSRTGDPITGTVTYPLCKNGELVACKEGELLLAPGTKVNGTVLFAQKAPDKYWRPRLVLDFSNIVYRDGSHSPLYARVLSVDNARETVRNNEILGIVQPHAAGKDRASDVGGERGAPGCRLHHQRRASGLRVIDSTRSALPGRDGLAVAGSRPLHVEAERGLARLAHADR